MNRSSLSKRVAGIIYGVVHNAVRVLTGILVLLVGAFVFLRLYGVPDSALQLIINRVNAEGIPIHVESLSLTLRGWLAEGVSYYSRHPDDLAPLFEADEVLFARRRELESADSKGWKLDFEARNIRFTPSVEWGVKLPEACTWRRVDHARLTMTMLPDRVEFSDAEMSWLGVDFLVEGVLLKKTPEHVVPGSRGTRPPKAGKEDRQPQETVLPVYVGPEEFQALENRLKQLEINGDARVELRFSVDMNNYADSTLEAAAQAEAVAIRKVGFDRVAVDFAYAYPELKLEQLSVVRNAQELNLAAEYDLGSGLIQGQVNNSITSSRLLLLAPQVVLDVLVKAQLQFDELPAFSLRAGPCRPEELPNHLAGSFSVRDLTYSGLLIESARGNIERTNGFLELSELYAHVQGQEDRAEEFNSCMQGGAATGRVFWDANRATFGVEAEGSLDPNLLIDPLSIVPIATNVIDRFYFPTELPQISLKLGSCYTNWSTFYIDISGVGHEVGFHEALLSTANVSAFYTNSVLTLDPIAAMDGVDFIKGEAEINFREDRVYFDAFGSIHPELVEDAVWPYHNIFGHYLKTSGDTAVKARGTVDWGSMEQTDFIAEVEAEGLEIPVAKMDRLKATVIGSGPMITVTNAVCDLYGGSGDGSFALTLMPGSTNLPFFTRFRMNGVDVRQLQQSMGRPVRDRTMGRLTGQMTLASDLTAPFLEHADGGGSISIEDGELADLPVFTAFSNIMRKVMPGFNFFSITHLKCDFVFQHGLVKTDDAVFQGDLFSATASGLYSSTDGYDANVRVNVFNNKGLSKVIRVITSPISKLFEMHLSGTLDEPVWRLKNFTTSPDGSDDDSG
ncbi:AsmA-like C-terminal region-containing protein [Pontiella sp.]|uniref:AsmA-like C-terminal region-containing protein n=1 Tax=Pontiella sp. TaxID=2837462 RepID=UPI0035677E80